MDKTYTKFKLNADDLFWIAVELGIIDASINSLQDVADIIDKSYNSIDEIHNIINRD